VAGETVAITGCFVNGNYGTQARMTTDALVMWVSIRPDSGFFDGFCGAAYALFPNVPAGTYRVGVELSYPGTGPAWLGTLIVAAGGPATPAFTRLSGNWFDPAGPGRGLNIVQGASGALMVLWLDHGIPPTYEPQAPQAPSWLVMPSGQWTTPTTFRGLL
jgi:hypothetical protein